MKEWRKLPQEMVRKWIEGVIHNIQEVIRLEGGNEYQEGRGLRRSYRARRTVGQLFKHVYIQDEENSNTIACIDEDEQFWADLEGDGSESE